MQPDAQRRAVHSAWGLCFPVKIEKTVSIPFITRARGNFSCKPYLYLYNFLLRFIDRVKRSLFKTFEKMLCSVLILAYILFCLFWREINYKRRILYLDIYFHELNFTLIQWYYFWKKIKTHYKIRSNNTTKILSNWYYRRNIDKTVNFIIQRWMSSRTVLTKHDAKFYSESES